MNKLVKEEEKIDISSLKKNKPAKIEKEEITLYSKEADLKDVKKYIFASE